MSLLGFLFGKKPKIIFTPDGRTKHQFSKRKWERWKERFEQNPEYNWRNHKGTKGKSH